MLIELSQAHNIQAMGGTFHFISADMCDMKNKGSWIATASTVKLDNAKQKFSLVMSGCFKSGHVFPWMIMKVASKKNLCAILSFAAASGPPDPENLTTCKCNEMHHFLC